MIIVSQDRDFIINFNKVTVINREMTHIGAQLETGETWYIAEYSTEERAKEVLKEIADRYEILELARYSSRYELVYGEHTYSYEMPLE